MNSAGTGRYAHRIAATDVEALRESVERWQKWYAEAIEQLADSRLHARELDARIRELERTLAAILELNPASPAAIKVAREMAKQALER